MASVFKRGGKNNRGGYWYASWFDHTGRRRSKCTKTTDKATAEQIARKAETEAAKRREGLIDPQLETFVIESRRPLEDVLAEYQSKLVAAQRTPKHVKYSVEFVRSLAKFAGYTTLGELAPEGVTQYARHLSDKGRSARTVQSHLNAIKGFTKWLVAVGKCPRDPLATVNKPNPQTDRRRERRMLLPAEWPRLQAATAAGPEREGMSGEERMLLYRVAIQTGLRANELRSLTRTSVVVDAPRPYIRVKAADTKNAKAAQQFIDGSIAAALKSHVRAKTPGAQLFNLPHETYLARMLRDDLSAARESWLAEAKGNAEEFNRRMQTDFLAAKNHQGQRLDFHSLRHTCGAWLAQSGAHPKTVQAVMRHSTITLTMDTYGHLLPGAESEAADQLGAMISLAVASDDERNILSLTGTDGDPGAQRTAQQLGRGPTPKGATADDYGPSDVGAKKTPKPIVLTSLGEAMPECASLDASSGGGTRTPDTRIMIPLCTAKNAEKIGTSQDSAAPGAAVESENVPSAAVATGRVEGQGGESEAAVDADLALLNERWQTLPEAIRMAIVALVRTSQ